VALIPDGVHVAPAMLKLAIRAKGIEKAILTTDRTAIAGLGSAEPKRRHLRIERGAMRFDDGALAGSIISMLDGVRTMVKNAGVTLGDAVRMAAANPAMLLGHGDRGRIEAGARADLIVLDRDLKLRTVFAAGCELV
ncbi:MAG: amidohydrolase family protein, partial [Candidatus Binataceae bacterium]